MCNYVQSNVQFSHYTDIIPLVPISDGVIHATETHMVTEQNLVCYLVLTALGGTGAEVFVLVCIRMTRTW